MQRPPPLGEDSRDLVEALQLLHSFAKLGNCHELMLREVRLVGFGSHRRFSESYAETDLTLLATLARR
jgi:hypothetical protein